MTSRHRQRQRIGWSSCLVAVLYFFNQARLLAWMTSDRHRSNEDEDFSLASSRTDNPPNVPTGMWSYGKMSSSSPPTPLEMIIDILSIGSQRRWTYLEAQRQTMGMHPTVRHFFIATERDDVDPHCDTRLNAEEDLPRIRAFCQSQTNDTPGAPFARWRRFFAPPSILRYKTNPVGWLCAQSRPAIGLTRVLMHYHTTGEAFPDYLILQDDDTYWNMDLLSRILRGEMSSSGKPRALAGCLFRLPHLWVPHGGFGLILNRALLYKLTSPLEASYNLETMKDGIQWQEHNMVQNNATVMDWIYSYAMAQQLTNYHNWTEGFCAHSDWIWGYVLQAFSVASLQVLDHPDGSSQVHRSSRNHKGICHWKGGLCNNSSLVCHSVTPVMMSDLFLK